MLRLSEMFESSMVLQQGRPLPVWGVCDQENAIVRISVAGTEGFAQVKEGRFRATLPALQAGGPFTLTATAGPDTIVLSDVLVGEVWLAGGQSNMEMPLFAAKGAGDWLKKADFSRLRLKTISRKTIDIDREYGFHFIPESSDPMPWQTATPKSAALFSAIGVAMGEKLTRDLDVPVGVISCNFGATKVQPWVSPETLEKEPAFAGDLDLFCQRRTELGDNAKKSFDTFQQQLSRLSVDQDDYIRQSLENPLYYYQGDAACDWPPDYAVGDANFPCCLYLYMMTRVIPFAMRGVIWYQGESSATAEDTPRYLQQMQALVRDWRRAFENDELYWIQAQLAAYDTSRRAVPCDWPTIREAQRRLCREERNVFLINLMGISEIRNIHPVYKLEAAQRMANMALHAVYGRKSAPVAPEVVRAWREKGRVHVLFAHGEGLHRNGEITQLEIGGKEGFQPAQDIIVGENLVTCQGIGDQVRFGWHCMPEDSLKNAWDLPVTPFAVSIVEESV